MSVCLWGALLFSDIFLGRWRDTNQSQQEMKYGVVGNPAYDVVHVQGSAGDGLEPDYNMENNPLYEMRRRDIHTRQKQQLVLVFIRMLTVSVYEEEGNATLFPHIMYS